MPTPPRLAKLNGEIVPNDLSLQMSSPGGVKVSVSEKSPIVGHFGSSALAKVF